MALYAATELKALGVQTGIEDTAFDNLVAMVDGIITAYVNEHTPEDDRAGILDSGAAQSAQLQLVRLYLMDSSIREYRVGDLQISPRSLRFEEPRILRRLVPPTIATGETA